MNITYNNEEEQIAVPLFYYFERDSILVLLM